MPTTKLYISKDKDDDVFYVHTVNALREINEAFSGDLVMVVDFKPTHKFKFPKQVELVKI